MQHFSGSAERAATLHLVCDWGRCMAHGRARRLCCVYFHNKCARWRFCRPSRMPARAWGVWGAAQTWSHAHVARGRCAEGEAARFVGPGMGTEVMALVLHSFVRFGAASSPGLAPPRRVALPVLHSCVSARFLEDSANGAEYSRRRGGAVF